jgi:hypothetical protein
MALQDSPPDQAALATITPEGQIPTVAQLDQFHTGGILATAEFAGRGLLREALPRRWLEF